TESGPEGGVVITGRLDASDVPRAHSFSDHVPLSLHDALPISPADGGGAAADGGTAADGGVAADGGGAAGDGGACHTLDFGAAARSEEHTSELQSRRELVCRLLLEKNIHARYGQGDRRLHSSEK